MSNFSDYESFSSLVARVTLDPIVENAAKEMGRIESLRLDKLIANRFPTEDWFFNV